MGVLSVRVENDVEKLLDLIMKKRSIQDKSSYIRSILKKSLTEDLIDLLCEEVKEGKISAWYAASMAEITLSTFLMELGKRDISLIDDIDSDLEFADLS